MPTQQWPLCDLGGDKKFRSRSACGNGHGHGHTVYAGVLYARLRLRIKDHPRTRLGLCKYVVHLLCIGVGILIVPTCPYDTSMRHTQPAQRSPARSPRQVPLLRGDILAASSQPLKIAQRDFGVRFMCV